MKDAYDVYLAGPFFNTDQKMVMEGARLIFEEAGLVVCDPQDLSPVIVDLPEAERKEALFKGIFENNIEGMERSWCLFACIDDRDTGTAFELGWFCRELRRSLKPHDGAIFTFSGHGHGCNVMLSQAVDGHFGRLSELNDAMKVLGPMIKQKDRAAIVDAMAKMKNAKAGSTE